MSAIRHFVMLNLFQHPTRGTGFGNASSLSLAAIWTLKQVRGDGCRGRAA